MTDKKEYKDTNKSNDKNETTDLVKSHSDICGIKSIPGVYYTSSIVPHYCSSCKETAPTKVESSWNIKSYLCCYFCGPYWFCNQLYRGKDFIIKDANHRCSSCDVEIAKYESC